MSVCYTRFIPEYSRFYIDPQASEDQPALTPLPGYSALASPDTLVAVTGLIALIALRSLTTLTVLIALIV